MIKIVKADKYSHCSSCGKANEYFYINALHLMLLKFIR